MVAMFRFSMVALVLGVLALIAVKISQLNAPEEHGSLVVPNSIEA